MLSAEDVAQTVLDLLRMRDGAHASRVELRPTRPPAAVAAAKGADASPASAAACPR